MDNYATKKKIGMYGLPVDFSALAPDSIRYPPGVSIPNGLVNTPKLKEKMSADSAALSVDIFSFSFGVLTKPFGILTPGG